jgi:uncharacterized protein (TIGR02145 family)
MKKTISIICFVIATISNVHSIDYTLNFSGSGASTTIDSVIVQNLTKGTQIVVQSGNALQLTVVSSLGNSSFNFQDELKILYNEASENNSLRLFTPTEGRYFIRAYDLQGKKAAELSLNLQSGENRFNLDFPKGIYSVNVSGAMSSKTERFISTSTYSNLPTIEFNGFTQHTIHPFQKVKSAGSESVFNYSESDMLLLNAKSGNYSTLVTVVPTESKTVNFEFVECKDASGKHYAVTKIGNQFWMAENLSYLPVEPGSFGNESNHIPFYYVHDKDKYGVMYNWEAAKASIPAGWHLPSLDEWFEMRDYLGGRSVAGGKLKTTDGWNNPNESASNSSGFSAKAGGYKGYGYGGEGIYTAMWSSTIYTNQANSAFVVYLNRSHNYLVEDNEGFSKGFYVRCVMGY